MGCVPRRLVQKSSNAITVALVGVTHTASDYKLKLGGALMSVRASVILVTKEATAMQAISVEIRAAEGGDDAKLLVQDQAAIYQRFCKRHCL